MKISHINVNIYDKTTTSQIIHIFYIISLFNLPFFHIFHIFSLFNLLFLHIFHIFLLFNSRFFHIFHIFSLFNFPFFHIFNIKETSSSPLPPTHPVVTAAAAPIHTYPRAAAAVVAATTLLGHRSRRPHSVEIPPKTLSLVICPFPAI
jgi:hypothetical protein